MKRFIFLFLALAAMLPASADSYLTLGVNDTLRINPTFRGGIHGIMLRAHFDLRVNIWSMGMQLPYGMSLMGAAMRNDMLYIPYMDYQGDSTYCSAQLFCDTNLNTLSASIEEYGYMPFNNNNYVTYGLVKWEAGDYDEMCELYFRFETYFPDTASVYINEHLMSTYDMRSLTIPDTYIQNKRIFLYVGYMLGDVNGDEQINIADMSDLIDYLLHHAYVLDEYQLYAYDVDGNGIVDIGDVSAMADLLQTRGYALDIEFPTI